MPEDEEISAGTEPLSDQSPQEDEAGFSDDDAYYQAFDDNQEYDLEGEPITDQPAQQQRAVVGNEPPAFDLSGLNLTEEQEDALRDRLAENPLDTVRQIIRDEIKNDNTLRSASDFHLDTVRADAPEFYRKNQAMMRQGIATLPPAQRATKGAAEYAVLFAIGNRAQTVGVKQAIAEAAQQFNGKGRPTGAQPRQAAAPALPPTQRATSPSTSPAGARGGSTASATKPSATRNPQGAAIARMAARTGMSQAAVRAMLVEADQI